MNRVWTSLKKYRKWFLFLNSIFVIGIIAGFIYFNKVNNNIVINFQENLLDIEFNSNIIYHIIFLAVVIFFSLFVIGSAIGLFLYFYEALSIGFIFGAFFSAAGFTGFLYSLIYVVVFRLVYIFLLSFILIRSFNLSRNIIGYFVLKKENSLKNLAISNFLAIIKCSGIILLYDLFAHFLGNSILSIFDFLI